MVAGEDILNFALQLECLEAEFYSWAAYGESISGKVADAFANNAASEGGKQATLASVSNVCPAPCCSCRHRAVRLSALHLALHSALWTSAPGACIDCSLFQRG